MPLAPVEDLDLFGNVPESIRALIADPNRTLPLPWYFACLKNSRVRSHTRDIVTTFYHRFPTEIRHLILLFYFDSGDLRESVDAEDSISPFKALIWNLTNLSLTPETVVDIHVTIPIQERKLEATAEYYWSLGSPEPEKEKDQRDLRAMTGYFFDPRDWLPDAPEDYLRRMVSFRCVKGMTDEWRQAMDEEKDFKMYATQFRQDHGLETESIGPVHVAKKNGTTIEEEFLIY